MASDELCMASKTMRQTEERPIRTGEHIVRLLVSCRLLRVLFGLAKMSDRPPVLPSASRRAISETEALRNIDVKKRF